MSKADASPGRVSPSNVHAAQSRLSRYANPSLQILLDMTTLHMKVPSNSAQSLLEVQYPAHTD